MTKDRNSFNVPEVKSGHPLYDHKQFSPDDEKKVDIKGDAVVDGLPWSAAKTGTWLTLFGFKKPEGQTIGHLLPPGADWFPLTEGVQFMMAVTPFKPRFVVPGWGACIELPSDLGDDALKRDYLTQWMVETTKEILEQSGARVPNPTKHFEHWIEHIGDRLIWKAGM